MSPLNRYRHFRNSFRSRLFLVFTGLTLLIALSFMLLTIDNEMTGYHERSNEKAQLLAAMLADRVRLPLFSGDLVSLEKAAADLLTIPHAARVVISDHEGRVMVDLGSAQFREGGDAVATARKPVIPSSDLPGADAALSGAQPGTPSAPIGTVTVLLDISDLKSAIYFTLAKTGALILLFWGAVLVVTYPLLKRITRSFDSLTDGLDSMMQGDFTLEIAAESDDEAGRAARAVNRLARTLQEREEENRKLQAELVDSLRLEVLEEKRMLMAKLIQTNRMTSLGLLISSMAHNINTPNGAIKLAAQHLRRSLKDIMPLLEHLAREEGDFQVGGLPFSDARDEVSGAAESICRNAERVERVIQDLRSYTTGERSEFSRDMSVNRVVEEALTIIRAHGRQADIAIHHRLAAGLPLLTGNQHQMEQVVVNLLLNAMQAMQSGSGSVTVSTGHDQAAGEVWIRVADQGNGIPDEVMGRLFEPFVSTRLDRGGSGLGLYISHFIVTEHRGRITVETMPGEGAAVTVYLPTG